MKVSVVYIVTNRKNGTIYAGVTSNLIQRIFQHKNGLVEGFTKKYNCKQLVYYEIFETMLEAIEWEKKVKQKSRKEKLKLITSKNQEWKNLSDLF